MNVLDPLPQTNTPSQHNTRIHRRWIAAYALYTAATNATFTQAVWVVYLYQHGYSPFAIGLFEMIFHIGKFIAEVPTGIFADLIGRRASLMVSCVLGVLTKLFFLHPVAPLLAASFALEGVAYAFRGGADSALLWTLAERSQPADVARRYSTLFSRMLLVTIFAQTLTTASGGFLSAVTSVLPFLCAGLASALAIVPLLMLPEQRGASRHDTHPVRHLATGLRVAWQDPALLGLVLLSGLTASVVTTVGYYTQLYFASLGYTLAAIGLIIAASVVPDSVGAAITPRLLRAMPRLRLLIVFTFIEALGVLAMAADSPWLALAGFLVLLRLGDGVLYPAISSSLNERSPEAQRATVLSFETGLFSATMIVLFPLFGLGLSHASYTTVYGWTFAALVLGGLAIGLFTWLRLRRTGLAAVTT